MELGRFKIGDTAWWPHWTTSESFVTCPDCGGTGRIRVTFHDETTASITCGNCAPGYDPPTGRVRVYDRKPHTEQVYLNGVEIGPESTRWRLGHSDNCYSVVPDEELFLDEAESLAYAIKKCAELDEQDRKKVFTKEKDTRSWAWNASYHRRGIKEAERQLEYHRSKLAVAALKAKEKVEA